LIAHRIVPYRWTWSVARGVAAIEVVLGLTGVAVVAASVVVPIGLIGVVAGATAAWFGLLAWYSSLQLRRSPHAGCGCFGDSSPSSGITVARSLLVGLLAGLPMVALSSPVGVGEVGGALVGAVPLAVIARYLPAMATSRKAVRTA
jgi:hypothetical protein